MNIEVTSVPRTSSGTFAARYDPQSKILVLESDAVTSHFGINVNSEVNFDLDAGRVLIVVDVLRPSRTWKCGTRRNWPATTSFHDLMVSEAACRQHDFELEVSVRTNDDRTEVEIEFGDDCDVENETAFALSDSVVVFIADDRLTALLVRLERRA